MLTPKRITINLSTADLLEESSHYNLAIAIVLLVVMNVIPQSKKFSLTSLLLNLPSTAGLFQF
ncbi:MAG: magnesium chelatase domain-containing protein [Wolbachia sp.]